MIRRSRATLSTLLGAALAATLLAGCGAAAATPTASRHSGSAPSSSAPGSSGAASGSSPATGSASVSGSPAASASDQLGLPHADAALEDTLPSVIGGVPLSKFSMTLKAFMGSSTKGVNALYPVWLLRFNKIPSDVIVAAATNLTNSDENFAAYGIKIPGVDAATLRSSFGEVAAKAGWPVKEHQGYLGKTILEIIDPDTSLCQTLCTGVVYATPNVLYTIVTDDQKLLNEALIKMP